MDRLNRLINDILDLAHMESGKASLNIKSGEINKTIQSVMEAQEAVARAKGLYLKVSLDSQVPVLAFDPDKIVQVLNNLISNAIKFTAAGGITISSVTDEAILNPIRWKYVSRTRVMASKMKTWSNSLRNSSN